MYAQITHGTREYRCVACHLCHAVCKNPVALISFIQQKHIIGTSKVEEREGRRGQLIRVSVWKVNTDVTGDGVRDW